MTLTDSSTLAGCLVKSNFDGDHSHTIDKNEDPTQIEILLEVRCNAIMMMDHNLCEYSQWFRGEENNVMDSHLWDDNILDDKLTHLLTATFPEQVPDFLAIVPLPKKIS